MCVIVELCKKAQTEYPVSYSFKFKFYVSLQLSSSLLSRSLLESL